MIDRDDGDGMRGFAESQQALGDDRRRKIGREIDDWLAAKLRKRPRGGRKVNAELRIEEVRALKQKGESPLRNIRA